jgi:DNA-binding response OmpR family regulator
LKLLRQKLEEAHQPQWILTVLGLGYRLAGVNG